MRPGIWVAIGAGLIVIIAAIVGFVMWNEKEPFEEASDRPKFVAQCIADFERRGALSYENTSEQLEASCNCLADGFYPIVSGKSRAQLKEEMQKPDVKKRLVSMTIKCANKIGLDGLGEWY